MPQHACPKGNSYSWCWRKPRKYIWSSPRLLIGRNQLYFVDDFCYCVLSKKHVTYPHPNTNHCQSSGDMGGIEPLQTLQKWRFIGLSWFIIVYRGFSLHIRNHPHQRPASTLHCLGLPPVSPWNEPVAASTGHGWLQPRRGGYSILYYVMLCYIVLYYALTNCYYIFILFLNHIILFILCNVILCFVEHIV